MLNFNEIGCKQCNENGQMASDFCYFSNTVHEICEKLFPRVKSEIQIRDFFPAKPEKSKIRKIILPQKSPTTSFQEIVERFCGNCERFCLSSNLSVFVSRFQQSLIRKLRKSFGQESYRPPSPKVPVRLCTEVFMAGGWENRYVDIR